MLKKIYFKLKREMFNRMAKILFKVRRKELIDFSKNGKSLVEENFYSDVEVIVSLTSYSKRIRTVHLTIESLAKQSNKANRIILWLDESEVTLESIPNELKKQIDRGLDVRFCKNIKSYKKLIPTLQIFPNADIITVDDDVIYPSNMISKFIENRNKYPGVILCNRAHLMKVTSNDTLFPYMDWEFCTNSTLVSKYVFATGIGGVYYPSKSLHTDVTHDDVFMELCPTADDVWFKFMALRNNTETKRISSIFPFELSFLSDDSVQDIALSNENNSDVNKNDIQIRNLMNMYMMDRI
ncbi:hypothetical protein ACSTD6_20285 [Vibrio vulnificus]|uniref:hypothetical protein n=1 Tax=Vibrio vulnificus TaxID=672 RepID=UPI003ED933A7